MKYWIKAFSDMAGGKHLSFASEARMEEIQISMADMKKFLEAMGNPLSILPLP